ncbi:MAG: hypothetical protein LWX07_07665 [Bacteroidetes bacterium]|nr:hypothetical protein [Bacteroidota bacterium]
MKIRKINGIYNKLLIIFIRENIPEEAENTAFLTGIFILFLCGICTQKERIVQIRADDLYLDSTQKERIEQMRADDFYLDSTQKERIVQIRADDLYLETSEK